MPRTLYAPARIRGVRYPRRAGMSPGSESPARRGVRRTKPEGGDMAASGTDEALRRSQVRRALVASTVGTSIEWGGSVTLSMEWGNPRRRGFIASWPQVGVPIGLLLSTGAVSLFSHVTGDSFETWGWRIPFLLSLVLIGVGLWIRLGVLESPLF